MAPIINNTSMWGVGYKEPKTLLKGETDKTGDLIERELWQVARGTKSPEEAAASVSGKVKSAAEAVVGFYQNPAVKEGMLAGAEKALEEYLECAADLDNKEAAKKTSRKLSDAIAEAELAGLDMKSVRDRAVIFDESLDKYLILEDELKMLRKGFGSANRNDKKNLAKRISKLQKKGLNVDKLRELFSKI